MSLSSTIHIDPRQLRDVSRTLQGVTRGVPRVIHRAVTRTTTAVRVRIVDAVYRNLNTQRRFLYQRSQQRNRPIAQKLHRGGQGTVTGGHVEVRMGRIYLGRFQPKQHWRKGRTQGRRRAAVSYKIDRGGGRTRVDKDLFVAEFKSGHVGIFRRKSARRTDIVPGYGPSVPQVASNRPEVQRVMRVDAAAMLNQNLSDEARRLIERSARSG